ncbi:MAG: hypothetical protein AABY16_00140 [Nanoarchaeota archaeon]
MDAYRKIWPVLLVDDEWSDIRDMEEVLRNIASERYERGHQTIRPVFPVHAVSPDEAMDHLIKYQRSSNRFSAVVCDNHMGSEDAEGIDGDEFIRIITGNLNYCFPNPVLERDELPDFDRFSAIQSYCGRAKPGVIEFLEERFGDEGVKKYLEFVNYWFGQDEDPTLIMLCGAPREVNRDGFDDVYLVQKSVLGHRNGLTKRHVPCERIVLDILAEKGVLPRNLTDRVIAEHSRLSQMSTPNEMCFRPTKGSRGY